MKIEKELQKNVTPFLNCKDHTVSGEYYEVMKNSAYDLLVTSPIPVDLENYYQSENYISHTDSKKNLFEKVYQMVKKYALMKKVSLINSFNYSEKTVLDIGAGTGDFLAECLRQQWTVFGVEPNLKAREIAAKKNIVLSKDLTFFQNQKFDVITLWHVLEHVENLQVYLSTIKHLLKENGTLVVAVPNHKSFDALYYQHYWAAFDVPRHLWHFSQTSIKKIFSIISMQVVQTIPMKFDAYYVALLSEKYKRGTMHILNALRVAFLSNWKAKRTSEYSSLIYLLKKD